MHLQKFMTSKDDSVITILFTWPKVQVKFLNQSALKDFRKLEIEDQADGTRGFHFHDLAKIESVLFKSSWNCLCCNFNQLRVQNGWSRFRSGHQVAPDDHQLIDRFELNHQSWPFGDVHFYEIEIDDLISFMIQSRFSIEIWL